MTSNKLKILLMALAFFATLQASRLPEPIFDPKAEPAHQDWQYFLKLSQKQRLELWGQFARKGMRFEDWSWGWRLGWIRSCRQDHSAFCRQTIISGLRDAAAVVRSETALCVANFWSSDVDPQILKELETAYGHPGNRRKGEPMLVQRSVLYALKEIGSSDALRRGEKLAVSHSDTANYWERLR